MAFDHLKYKTPCSGLKKNLLQTIILFLAVVHKLKLNLTDVILKKPLCDYAAW